MASSHLPPTPASSTDIRGKEKLVPLAPSFTLPPSAYASDRATSSPLSSNGSDSSYHPHSPVSLDNAKRKAPTAAPSRPSKADDTFALPPPPTRNRKIIQMKPKTAAAGDKQQDVEAEAAPAKATGGRKKGNSNGTTAASRKVARKTAHSLIERRRRSKMNEEFGVLKDMIPACKGQEMHKLAILQASIDYLRYLERCITDLKADNTAVRQNSISQPIEPPTAPADETMQHDDNNDDDYDEEMSDTPHRTGASTPNGPLLSHPRTNSKDSLPSLTSLASQTSLPPISNFPTMSPALPPSDAPSARHYSISSTSAPSFSPYIHSTQASPFFAATASQHEPAPFALTSPALLPQDSSAVRFGMAAATATNEEARSRERREKELDHEAMAALLMLNSDRRPYKDRSVRGMSVQDLLSN